MSVLYERKEVVAVITAMDEESSLITLMSVINISDLLVDMLC